MNRKINKVFIATSLDGFIADKNGGIDYLNIFPEINSIDTGYHDFVNGVDALLMGRATFEKVSSFDIAWPYQKPVYVISNSWNELHGKFKSNAILVKGELEEVLSKIHAQNYHAIYVDGGRLIQNLLEKDLIDEMVITVIPVLLGEGIPLFSKLSKELVFECKTSKLFLDAIVQNHFFRKR